MHRVLDNDITTGFADPPVIALAPQGKKELVRGSLDSLLAKKEMPHFPEAVAPDYPHSSTDDSETPANVKEPHHFLIVFRLG